MFSDGGELFLPAGVQLYGVEHKPLIDVNDNSRPNEEYVIIGALALSEGLSQNQDFFSLLLSNEEMKRQGLGIFSDEIYKSLRNA